MKNLIFLAIICLVVQVSAYAQLSSVGSIGDMPTSYVSTARQDKIFFFQDSNGDFSYNFSGATSYKWSKWDVNTSSFVLVLDDNTATSSLNNVTDGFYSVQAEDNSGILSTEYFWSFRVDASLSTDIADSNCSSFRLTSAFVGATSVSYFDPSSGQAIVAKADGLYSWSGKGGVISTQPYVTIYDLPYVVSVYKLTYKDSFGRSLESEVEYKDPLKPKAMFSITTNQDGEASFMAPLTVNFVNESQNDDGEYEWTLYKSNEVIKKETANNMIAEYDSAMYRLTSNADPSAYTYETPGTYKVRLKVKKTNKNDLVCEDSYFLDPSIVIDLSSLKVPEAFSPNGDGANDVLKIEAKSLKSLKFFIYNRWGRKVYSASLSNMAFEDYHVLEWDGRYNGKALNTGVYFYTIEAVGRDDEPRVQKGTIHLFNN